MSNPLGRKYHQKTLDKKYLKGIASDPTQSKLVFHDVKYQGQHYRQLGASGYNPASGTKLWASFWQQSKYFCSNGIRWCYW